MKPWVASHRDTRDHLSDYVEGGLDARTRTRIMRHLARCEGCRRMLESFKHTLEQLRSLGDVDQGSPQPATVRAVIERIERDSG
jgi:anti-sigma factor RsiW